MTHPPALETISGRDEGAVRFAEITASPTYQSGPELARALVSLIQNSEAGDAVRARHP